MIKPGRPANEASRLRALKELKIIDGERKPELYQLVRLASVVCDKPMATIGLVDETKVHCIYPHGNNIACVERDESFCGYAILTNGFFEIQNARVDERFHDSPLVTGAEGLAYYAGQALVTSDGFAIGTLCVLDRKPSALSSSQREALGLIADQIMVLLRLNSENTVDRLEKDRFRVLLNNMTKGVVLQDKSGEVVEFNLTALKILGLTADQLLGRTCYDSRWEAVHEDGSPFAVENHPSMVALRTGDIQKDELMGLKLPTGERRWISINATPIKDVVTQKPIQVVVTFNDVTAQRESNLELERFFEFGQEPMCIGTFDEILKVNYRFMALFGWDAKDLVGRRFDSLIHPEDKNILDLHMDRLKKGQPVSEVEISILDSVGAEHVLSCSIYPDLDNGHLYGSFRDVTIMRKMQRQLEDAQSIAKIGSWEYDIITGKISWSKQMFQYFPETLEHGPPSFERHLSTIFPDDRPIFHHHVNQAIEQGKSYKFRYRSMMGEDLLWLEARGNTVRNEQGKVVKLVGTVQNIMDRVTLEEENSLVIDALAIGIWKFNPNSNDLWWDKSMYRLFEIDEKDFSGHYNAWSSSLCDDSKADAIKELEAALAGTKEFNTTFKIKTKSGLFKHIGGRGKVLRFANGQPKIMYGINWDRSAEVALETTLEQERLKAAISAKMASLGEMAGGIAHEINNPLAIISGTTDQLIRMISATPINVVRATEKLHIINSTTLRISKIVKGLRSFSRNASADPKEACILQHIIQDSV